jgi:hypothetical protein
MTSRSWHRRSSRRLRRSAWSTGLHLVGNLPGAGARLLRDIRFSFLPRAQSFSSTRSPAASPGILFIVRCQSEPEHRPTAGPKWRTSQRDGHAVAILVPSSRSTTMRAYITVAGMAFGLVAVWAALVPLLV